MTGDIVLVGFVLTAEEWQSLDAQSRAQLLAAARQREPMGDAVIASQQYDASYMEPHR